MKTTRDRRQRGRADEPPARGRSAPPARPPRRPRWRRARRGARARSAGRSASRPRTARRARSRGGGRARPRRTGSVASQTGEHDRQADEHRRAHAARGRPARAAPRAAAPSTRRAPARRSRPRARAKNSSRERAPVVLDPLELRRRGSSPAGRGRGARGPGTSVRQSKRRGDDPERGEPRRARGPSLTSACRARRRRLRHPREPPCPRGGARGDRPGRARRDLVPRRPRRLRPAPEPLLRPRGRAGGRVPDRKPRPRRPRPARPRDLLARTRPSAPPGRRRCSSRRRARSWSRCEPQGEREGVGLFHASPRDPVWEYVLSPGIAYAGLAATPQQLVLVGHSHVALHFRLSTTTLATAEGGAELELGDDRWLLNPGSVGQPRDGDPSAAWLLLDLEARDGRRSGARTTTSSATQAEIRERGLPRGPRRPPEHGV